MTKDYDIYCVGLKSLHYCGLVSGGDAFEWEHGPCTRDILCCYVDNEEKTKIEITLETIEGWCGSGYTTATYGSIDIKEVESFGPMTHAPKGGKPIKINDAHTLNCEYDTPKDDYDDFCFDGEHGTCYISSSEIDNNVFSYDEDGGDSYYPCGHAYAKVEVFSKLQRAFVERPVWIFYGSSGTGKSTLASLMNDKVVYETDSAKDGELPEEIWCDVVVLGNKWENITLEEVRKRIPSDANIIEVNFKEADDGRSKDA